MTPELRRIVEQEIRHFLHQRGPRPPFLDEAGLDYQHSIDKTILSLVLVDRSSWHAPLPGRGDFVRYGGGDRRLFSRDCVRIYSQLYEDHLLEQDLRVSYEWLHSIVAEAEHPDQVRRAHYEHQELERHLRRHHRVRRDNPLMPVEPASYQLPPAPENTLTLESLQRAMQAMRRYSYDDLAVFGAAIIGIDPGSDVGDDLAQARALALLKGSLSAAQRAQYESKRHFEVIGSQTGKRYRIRHGRQMNIDELDAKGEKVCGWCFLPQGGLAAGDCMLAQKIALECDEGAALKVANRFGGPVNSAREAMPPPIAYESTPPRSWFGSLAPGPQTAFLDDRSF